MKKTNLFLLMGVLAFGFSVQKVLASDLPATWYLGMGMGADIPVQDWNPDYPVGGGGNLLVGCQFNPSFSLQLSISPWFFTGGGVSSIDVRNTLEMRLSNPAQGTTPYVLFGPGYDLQCESPSGYFTSSLALVGGLGFQVDLHPGEHAFVEGRYYLLVYNNITQQSIPVLFGLSEDL